MKNLKAARQRADWVRKRPRKVVRKYLKHCHKILSVGAYEPWKLRQMSLKIDWGRMKSSQRVHSFISKALELLLEDEAERGATLLAPLRRATHQMSLGNGSWEDAVAYMPGVDPRTKGEFAGGESEVEITAAQKKAMSELCKNRVQADEKDKKHDNKTKLLRP